MRERRLPENEISLLTPEEVPAGCRKDNAEFLTHWRYIN